MNEGQFWTDYNTYLVDPERFDEDQVTKMANFARNNNYDFEYANTDASLGSLASNLFSGFVQGFTTLPVGDKPTNEVDGIAHSIGHLLGFIGVFTPGGLAAKAGIGVTKKFAGKTIMGQQGWLGRSVPMQVADFARDKIRGTAIAKTALKSIDDIAGKRSGFVHQALRHGTHLGVASAVSSVWDNMEHAEDVPDYLASQFWTAVQGGVFGATFSGIVNMPIPKALSQLNVGRVTGKDVLKGVAGSLVQTVPGAMAGATTPENVYNALLGGFFGVKSKPWAYEKAYKRQNEAAKEAENESMDFEWYKTTEEWKGLSKAEKKAEEDVYRTLFAKGDVGEVVSNLEGTDYADPAVKTRSATVLDRHKKFGGQTVEVLNEMETMARVRVGGQDKPVNIRKEFLRFEDEVVDVKTVREKAKTLQQEIESIERETGNDSIEIPIVRPVENFFKKIKGVDELGEREYIKNLDALNRIIVGEVNKVKGERLSEKEYEKKLTELGDEAWSKIQDLRKNEGLQLKLPNNYAQRHRIGTIKTRNIAEGEDPKTGSRGIGEKAVDAIKELWVARGLERIDIEVKPGKTEEFYQKMGFKFVDKEGVDGKYRYTFDTTPLIENFQKKYNFFTDDPEVTPWSIVKKDILNRFKDKGITEEDMAEVRNFYRRSTESIKVPRFALMKGKLVEEKEFDFNNNRITNEESVKLIHRIAAEKGIVENMSDAYFTVKNTVLYKGGKRVQDKIGSIQLDGDRYKSVVKMASDMGYYPYSGKSDSQTLIFMKKNLGENYREEYNRIQADLKAIDPNFSAEYKALKAQATHPKKGNLNPKDFDEMFVSNVRWWEALNGDVNIKEMANNKGYLNDVLNFNKRQQVLFNNYYPLTSDTFNKPFKYVVVNNLHESNDPVIQKILKKWSPEHDDGYVLVRMDKLDLMASDMGLPAHSGFAKPFLTSNYSATEGRLGTLIGKLSFQGASPEMTKAMKDAGVDFIIPTSVAKQYGGRSVIDHNYNGKEIGFSSKGKAIGKDKIADFIYDMLPSEISVDWNTKDGSFKKIENGEMVKVFKQVQEKFMNHDVQKKMAEVEHNGKPIDINKVMNSFLREKFEGNDAANKLLSEYLEAGKRNPDMLKKVDKNFSKMGLKEVVEGMKDRTEAGEALRELVRHKVTRMEFDGMEDKSINLTKNWENDFQKEKLTNTQQILESAGTSDGVAMGKRIAPYMDRALTNYLLKRILQPQVTGAKGIMRGYHLDLALRTDPYGNTSRLLKENDIFFLDNNMEGLRMQVLKPSGRKSWGTLKEQWELYLAEKDGTPIKKQMEEMMRSIVTRSPIDGISGIADLKFAGFTGIKGGGILLHPETMKRLGGADLDIDSANFYMNSLPREVHKISDAFRNDFSDIMNHIKTKRMSSKDKSFNNVKYGDPKELIKAFIATDGIKGRKSFVGMFDPYLRAITANTIQDASGKMRGIAVNAQRDIRLLYATAKRSPGKKLVHEDADGNKVIFYPRQGEMDLKAKSWAAVGVTVDVANYGKLKSPEFFKAFLLDAGFRKVEVIPKKGDRYVMDFAKYLDYFKYEGDQVVRFTDSPISEFQNTMNKFYGKDWKTGLPWTRRDIVDAAEAHPKWDTSAYSQLAKLIKSVDYTDTMYERYQYNIDNFRNFFNQLNQISKESPEITRYVGGNKGFKGAYIQDLVKRMEVLNRFYSADRTNQIVYNEPYNLATTEGIKRMAYNKDMFNDFVESHTVTLKNGKKKNFITESVEKKNKKGQDVLEYKNKTYADYKRDETPEGREYFLRRYLKQINDFIDNDIEVFTSLKTINDIGRRNNIKADSHLPRYNLQKGGEQLASLNKVFMDLATEVKTEFANSYNQNKYNKRVSANSTSLDQIMQRLEGNDPMSIRNIVKQSVTYLNQNKRASDPEITEKGLRQYFDSLLLGSINADGKTASFYFTPQLVSREVLTQFNLNKQWAFKSSFERPSRAQLEKRLEGEDDVRVAKEAAALNKTVEEMEVLAPTKRISELDPDLQGYYSRISKQLKILVERTGIDADTLDKFKKGFFTIRGKGSTAEIDKYDLKGFESFLKDINNGSGLFRFITRGKGSKYFDWLREIAEDGKLKMALGPYLKMSESVAFDHLVNNFKLVERNVTAAKWVWKKDPETGKNIRVKEYGTYKAWAPQSHFGEMIHASKAVGDWTTGMRFQIEDETQANYGSVLIHGSRSQKNKADDLWRLASLEREAASTVIKTADGYKLYTDKTLRNQNEQTEHIKRLKKEGMDLLSSLEKEDYRYTIDGKTQNYSAREVIDTIKNNLDKDLADFRSNYIKVTPDFLPTMQGIIDKTRTRKIVKTKTGKLDITEIPVTFMEKYYMDPITRPGAIVSKDAKIPTLEEVAALSRETTYKEHSMGWRSVDEYNKIYSRPLKEVYALRHVQGMFKDDSGLRVSLYDFFRNPGEKGIQTVHAKKYLNNLLWMVNNKEPGWQQKLEESFEKFHTFSWKQKLLHDAYEAYKKFEVEQDKYSWNENNNIEKSLSIARNYFERKNNATKRDGSPKRGHVPWKPETDVYSQYEHDIALANRDIKMDVWIRQKLRHDPITGFQPVGEKENYFPHLGYDMQELYKEILNEADRISRKVENPEERAKAIDSLMRRHESIQEQSKKEDGGLADKARDNLLLKDMVGDRGIRALSSLGAGSRPGNMLTRKANLGGYKRDQAVIGEYKASVLNAIGTELQSVSFRRILNEFKKERPMGKHTKDWEMYMRIFARDMTGAPSTVDEEMLNSKTLNIKRTPWWYTSDQYLYSKKSVYNLVDKLSGRSKPNKFMKELYTKRQQGLETNGQMELFNPKKNESFEQWWDKQRQTFAIRYDKDGNAVEANMNWFSGKMKEYSQLEGKYQLATLLARMKVVVNNVFGGGTNAWVHIGAGPIRQSRKIEFWQSIDPRFKTMKDVDNWASELGIAEEMLKYDLGYLGMKRDPNWEVFSKDVAKLATEKWQNKGEDKLYDVRLRDLVKKHNIGSKGMDVAASFMGKSELFLRLNTFKAAYVAIRESMSPVEMKLNDPYLIEQAKKSVKASQFLYTAPFRPSFARTSAGKVYSRFKLWAWNSVKFRKDVYKEAKYAGFRPGSPEAKRLERMMTADLFMIGMAKLLPYTMFDYSLPAPYSYFQDTSDWLFGSDQQRERAFYGVLPKAIAPLHEFMPSILRGPEAVFGNLFSGNWERFADYTLVSHFPFGLLGRDIYNAAQSPALLAEFMTGIPLHRMGRLKDDIIEGKRSPGYSPGFY